MFPHLYNGVSISEDQVYDGCSFIGESYKKYIELINISRNQALNEKVKKNTVMTNLDALYLSKTEVENLFKNCMLIDSEY